MLNLKKMKPTELNHHVETILEMGEGIIDLHTHARDFHDVYARFLTQLRDRADEILTGVNELRERALLEEARQEPEYSY